MMVAFQMAKAKALANEFLKQGHQFRENTAVRHGLPSPDDVTEIDIGDVEKIFNMQNPPPPPEPKPVVASPIANTTSQPTTQIGKPTEEKKSLLQTLGPPVALATGILGGGWLIGNGLSESKPDTPTITDPLPIQVTTPVIVAPPIAPSKPPTGDLLKYLKDEGYNLPPISGG